MKNGFYFLGGLLLLAGACTAPDSYRLVGNLSGLADGTRMLLVPAATHKQEKPIGEAVVEDGKFVFEGQLPEPRLLNLQAEGKQLYYAFMLENGEVTITGEAVTTTDGDREMVTLNKAVVTGSKADREFREKIAFRQELDKAYTRLHQKYEDISRQLGGGPPYRKCGEDRFTESNRRDEGLCQRRESFLHSGRKADYGFDQSE